MRNIVLTMVIIIAVDMDLKTALAGFSGMNSDSFYKKNYSYNIFTAETWDIGRVFFAGYTFFGAKHSNIEYGDLMKQDHHGFVFGTGFTVNKNWIFSFAFQKVWQASSIPHYCSNRCKEIDKVRSEMFLINTGISVRLPFNFLEDKLNFYVLTGFDIISTHLSNSYSQDTETVPVGMVKNMSKANFGIDIGASVGYKIIQGVEVKLECKKVFFFLRKSALIKDGLLLNALLSFDF